MAAAIMVLGTASHVGKSLITAALCRILANDGYKVAPFKAQNMSLNSAATPDGLEIGRAQAMQAEAARTAPAVEMNPILLKPTSHTSAQVVLMGKVQGTMSASDYHRGGVESLFPTVVEAYRRLSERYDIIVLEGAGSPAEINLKQHDIVNMRMAQAAGAPCLLVGDIDRGGVFASLLGTVALLEPGERERIAAFAVNKFRGDYALLEPGVREIESRLSIPCAGVISWLEDVGLDEEDSVALDDRQRVSCRDWARTTSRSRRLRIAVVAFPYLSNFTDFDGLAAEPSVDLAYTDRPADLQHADVVILPGSKDTLGALRWIRANGLDSEIVSFSRERPVIGICGGMQILGERVDDLLGVEGGGSLDALGLLPIRTELRREKITRRANVSIRPGSFGAGSAACIGTGYEIHIGRTYVSRACESFATIQREGDLHERPDGAVTQDRRVIGTYLHGIFSDDVLRHAFLSAMRTAAGLDEVKAMSRFGAERAARFDRLESHMRSALDLSPLLPARFMMP